MKVLIHIVLLICVLSSCKDQAEIKEIKFDFFPSFSHQTHITIDYKKNTLNVNVSEDFYFEQLEYPDTTEPYIVKKGDTLITFYDKTFTLKDSDLEKFKIAENNSSFDVTTTHKRSVLDGISFKVSKLNTKNDTIFLNSNSPRRGIKFMLDYSLLDPLFELLYSSIENKEGISIIEDIQEYFDYQMIRKTNNNPLEIRIYGRLNKGCGTNNDFLTSYLESLPSEPIIFDCREGELSYCVYSLFEELAKNKAIYFYGKNEMIKCHKDVIAALDEEYEYYKEKDYKNEIWDELERKADLKYGNWLNNPNIKWFKTKEEILEHIAKKEKLSSIF